MAAIAAMGMSLVVAECCIRKDMTVAGEVRRRPFFRVAKKSKSANSSAKSADSSSATSPEHEEGLNEEEPTLMLSDDFDRVDEVQVSHPMSPQGTPRTPSSADVPMLQAQAQKLRASIARRVSLDPSGSMESGIIQHYRKVLADLEAEIELAEQLEREADQMESAGQIAAADQGTPDDDTLGALPCKSARSRMDSCASTADWDDISLPPSTRSGW